MSRWKITLIVLATLLVAVISYRFIDRKSERQRGAQRHTGPIPVTVVKVARRNVPIYLTAQGTVQAFNTVTVVPQVSGRLLSVNFREGHELQKGAVIAQIDPRTYRAALEQAQGKLAQAQAQLNAAKYLLSSYDNLSKKQFVAAQTLDAQRQTVRQYQAVVLSDTAAVDSARVQLSYTTIRAPIRSIAGLRLVDVGNVVGPNTTGGIVVLTQVHPISVIFNLPQQNLDAVRAAMAKQALWVTVLNRTDNQAMASGRLRVISNQIDPSTSTFRLKAEFANRDNKLWPGQFVNVRLLLGTQRNALVVPVQAVQRGPDGDYVFVVQPNRTVKMQAVVSGGEASASTTLIRKGLETGEQVVTAGQFRLKQGSKVLPLTAGETPPNPLKKSPNPRRRGRRRG